MKKYLKNRFLIYLFFLIYFFAYLFNPVNDFGDLASENTFIGETYNKYRDHIGLHFEPFKKLIHFDEKTPFTDWFDLQTDKINIKYSDPKKLSLRDFGNDYYLKKLDKSSKFYNEFEVIPKYEEDYKGYKCYFWFLCTRLDTIKALSHTVYKFTNDLFFFNDSRFNAKILISLIFIFTFIYSYLFGKALIGKNFGLIVAIVTASDLYFNALNRSFGIIPIAIHPLLFYISFYYLVKLFRSNIKQKFKFSLCVGFAISLNIFNGYPNTTIILNIMVILFLGFFYLGNRLRIFLHSNPISIFDIFIIIFSSLIFLLFFSSIYGIYVRGENIFYFVRNLDTRIINFIDYMNWKRNVAQIEADYFGNFITSFKSLIFPNIYQFHVHEQLFVFHIEFLNFFEKILLIISLPLIIYKSNIRKVNFYFFLPLLLIFLTFMLVFENNLMISRANYHFYSLVYVFISFSIYKVFLLIIKNRKFIELKISSYILNFYYSFKHRSYVSITNIFQGYRFKKKYVLLFLLLPIALQNLYQLNYYFINKYNSNLSGFYGLNEVNKYLKSENLEENDLVFFDFKKQSPINIQRLNNYNDDYSFEFLHFFDEYFKDINEINNFLERGNIFIVKKVISKISKITSQDHEFILKNNLNYIDLMPQISPVKIIKNKDKTPAYIIYKYSKNKKYRIENLKKVENIRLEKLDKIVIKNPGSSFILSCDEYDRNFYINGLENIDYYLIDLNKKEIKVHTNLQIDNFELFNLRSQKNPIFKKNQNPINKIFLENYSNTFFYNTNTESKFSKTITSSDRIENLEISFSTILFNDRLKRNKIYLQLVDENRIFFKNSKKLIHKSNQTNSYDLFRYIGPEGNLIGDMIKHNSINIKTNTKRLSTNIFISNYSDKKSGLLYFNDNNDISKYNYLKLNLDFPFNQKKSCNNLYYEGVGEVFFNTSY